MQISRGSKIITISMKSFIEDPFNLSTYNKWKFLSIQVFRSFLERTNDIENLTCDIYFAYPDKYSLNAIGKQVNFLIVKIP